MILGHDCFVTTLEAFSFVLSVNGSVCSMGLLIYVLPFKFSASLWLCHGLGRDVASPCWHDLMSSDGIC
ncbi:hypothetical protein BDV26DRAFT_253320 [Aspergillus bertholletiae]|uniref:Uncharacterized protein n=1 Tax=Aspergillus bertholletiae TaxID=1226010 RepID=A0A5N7BLH2_9EURO|nr:hypothetical protein BDV26DRAFT_253320 [Aspergillus bertholletiae]